MENFKIKCAETTTPHLCKKLKPKLVIIIILSRIGTINPAARFAPDLWGTMINTINHSSTTNSKTK